MGGSPLRPALVLLLLALPGPRPAGAEPPRIISTSRFAEVEELARKLGAREILVDFDDTLQTARQPAACVRHYDRLREQILRAKPGDARRADAIAMRTWNALQRVSGQRLVEPRTPRLLEKLKERCEVIGLTAQQRPLIEPVLTKLRGLGLTMSDAAARPRRLGADVWYAGGAIFCGLSDKASALALFERERPLKGPVLLIDDKRKNLEQVLDYLRGRGISAVGVHYRAVVERVPYDPELADAQLAGFLRTGELR